MQVSSLLTTDDAILEYEVPPMHEQYMEPVPPGEGPFPYRSVMELQPTPMASQRALPHVFKYVDTGMSLTVASRWALAHS